MTDRMIATVAVASAFVSACLAFASWWYNRELSRAALSLIEVKIGGKRVEKGKLRLQVLFMLKNVGKETLKMSEVHLGVFSFRSRVFQQIAKRPMPNPMHAEAPFNYSIPLMMNIDPQIPDEEIAAILPNLGKHALVLTLKYKGASIFSIKERSVKYFAAYDGLGPVRQLDGDEYREIERELPPEFRASE